MCVRWYEINTLYHDYIEKKTKSKSTFLQVHNFSKVQTSIQLPASHTDFLANYLSSRKIKIEITNNLNEDIHRILLS